MFEFSMFDISIFVISMFVIILPVPLNNRHRRDTVSQSCGRPVNCDVMTYNGRSRQTTIKLTLSDGEWVQGG